MDQQLLFLINRQWTNPALDRLMATVTNFSIWLWPMLLLALVLAIRGGFRTRAFLLVAGMVVGINDGLVSNPLKHLIDRPRPFQSHNDVRQVELAKTRPRLKALVRPLSVKLSRAKLVDVEGRSFPSSHTMNTISVAMVCAAFYRRRGWLAFAPALLIAYSRIYTGSHWPSDVITSIFLAVGTSFLLLAACEWAWRRTGARFLPELHAGHPSLFA